MVPPSPSWGHPMAVALWGSGHRGPPIPTLGTPHGHCSGEPWPVWSPHPHLGDTPWPPLQGYLGTMVPLSSPWGQLGTPHGYCSGEPWAPWSPHPHLGDTPWPRLWGPRGPGAALEQRMGPGLSVRRCRPRRRVFSEQQKPLCAASRQERGGPGWEGGGSGAAAVPCRAVVCRAVPCRAVPPQQGGDSFVPPCRRRRACR